MKDYYQILGVARTATEAEIKQAYRKLARVHHPDVNKGDKKAEERFKEISEAYNVLSDPEQRKKYDMFGKYAAGSGGGGQQWSGGVPPGFDFRDFQGRAGQQADFGDLNDLFQDLFNMGGVKRGRKAEQRGWAGEQTTSVDGQDTFTDIEISFYEAIQGAQRKISIKRGDQIEQLTVKIPAGVDNGSKVRVAAKGQPGFGGGQAGDLYLHIKVSAHPEFWREGADIYCELAITIYDAVLGTEAVVPTISGTSKIKIPAGTASGQKFRLKGKGAPVIGKKQSGDQYVVIQIVPPLEVERELKREIEDLAERFPYQPDPKKNVQ